jgi:molecular chaperone GrpE
MDDNKKEKSETGETAAEKIEELHRQLEAKDTEAKENFDRFLRQAAELDNFKKRMAREKAEAIRYGNEALIKDLLPVLDNLDRAVEYAKGGADGKPLIEGIEMVRKSFLEALNKHGVAQISAVGEAFDPERHEAIAQIESREQKPNTVIEEHHKGYYLLDRLLRPAQVIVSKVPESEEKKGK